MRKLKLFGLMVAGAVSAPAFSQDLSGDAYDALRGCEKQSRLWSEIEKTTHSSLPAFEKLGLKEVSGMLIQSVRVKLSRRSDVAPEGWKKHLHARGSVAKVKFVPVDNAYTGLFKGVDCGLIRLSLTAHPKEKTKGGMGVAPGAAVKFLIDGQPSVNFSALASLRPQGQNYNFFEHSLSNIVPRWRDMGANLVHMIFRTATRNPEQLGISEMGAQTKDGKRVGNPRTPVQLFLVPGSEKLKFANEEHDVRGDFAKIPTGTVLYRVHAATKVVDYDEYREEDKAALEASAVHVGDIVTTSAFVASEFGDSKLFFRHQRSD